MHVAIKSLDGKHKMLAVTPTTTVGDLKTMIYNTEGYQPEQQRLVFGGRDLFDERTMADYDVVDSNVIHLVLRIRGGMMHTSSGRTGTGQVLVEYWPAVRARNWARYLGLQVCQSRAVAMEFLATRASITVAELEELNPLTYEARHMGEMQGPATPVLRMQGSATPVLRMQGPLEYADAFALACILAAETLI